MKGWKTLVFNAAVGVLAVLAEVLAYLQVVDWNQIVPAGTATIVMAVIGVVNIILRHVTASPAGWRQNLAADKGASTPAAETTVTAGAEGEGAS